MSVFEARAQMLNLDTVRSSGAGVAKVAKATAVDWCSG